MNNTPQRRLRWALPLAIILCAAALLLAPRQPMPTLSPDEVAALSDADATNSLSIVFVRSDSPLDWSTPARISRTALGNYLDWQAPAYSHPIGHAFAHIRCGQAASDRDVWAGVTGGGTKGDLYRFIFGGEGLGIMTGSFTGRMMTLDEILRERRFHKTSGRAQRVRFLLSPAACVRVLAYYDEFVGEQVFVRFGLAQRPRWREGVGCTTFVLSLLEIAGIRFPAAEWSTSVRIPKVLIGTRDRTVSVFELLYGTVSRRWARSSEPSIALTFADVSKVEAWIRAVRAQGQPAVTTQVFGAATTFDDEGIAVDARSVPVPDEPMFYR